ncbi:MAG: ABC transporter permease [Azoarcus sp.]|jgi:ABC-2 type transport system permease protein|nr:ABC transporter permease [Azoarcus sp.]
MRLSFVRLRAQIVKELLCVLRDPKSRVILFVPPLVQLAILSFAFTLEVKNVDIAILNRDAGGAALEFVQRATASELVRRVHVATSEAEVAAMLDEQRVLAALVVPPTFSRDARRGQATVQVLIDGRRSYAGQIALGYFQTIAASAGMGISAGNVRDIAPVRHWFNPNLTYRWFVVPGLAGVLLTISALLLTALSIARERELGTFEQLLVSPCTPAEIIVAKTAPGFLIGATLALLMEATAVFGFGIPFTGSFALLFGSMLLFILSIVGIGLAISAVCSTQQQAILGCFALAIPTMVLSGFATPVDNMPEALQWLAQAIPLKHFLLILHGSFLKAMPASEVFANAWPMALIAAVTLPLAARLVRGKLQ